MLTEFKGVRQRPGEGYRRWYNDQYFDVILWYDAPGGELTGFQVCYDKGGEERAFTRKAEPGTVRSHRYVSNGPVAVSGPKMTSILRGDAGEIDERVIARLRERSGELDDRVLEALIAAMREYNLARAVAAGD